MTKEEIKKEFVSTYKQHVNRSGAALLLNHLLYHGFFEVPASTRYHTLLRMKRINIYYYLVRYIQM